MSNTVQVVLRGVDQFSATFTKATRDFSAFRTVAVSAAVAVAGAMTAATASAYAFTKAAIDVADETGKAAQRAGVAVEQFSALAYAGKLADVATEDLVAASRAWSVQAAKGQRETSSFTAELMRMADEFAATADGARKVALAQEAFGRGGQAMIPLLNAGSEALRQQFAEAERFGLVIGPRFSANAQQFNDNLTRMRGLVDGVGNRVAEAVLPTFAAFSEALLNLSRNSDLVQNTVTALTTVLLGAAKVTVMATEAWHTFAALLGGESLTDIGNQLLNFEADMEELRASLSQPLPPPRLDAASDAARAAHAQSLIDDFAARWAAFDDQFQAARQKATEDYRQSVQQLAVDELLVEKDKNFLIEQERQFLSRKLLKIEEDEMRARARIQAHAAQGTATIFGNLASLAAAFGKKGFEAFKAFRIAEAIASTYAGAARALADYPWPLSVAVAASVVAAGVANVATIASTKPTGQAHGGLGYVPEDATYRISRGERILSPSQNTDLTRFLQASGEGTGGPPVVIQMHVDGRVLAETIGTMTRDGRLEISRKSVV